MFFHLRFTPYDLSGYNFKWLERYPRYILAQEDENDTGEEHLHYHILIETDAHRDSVRDMVKTKLPIPPSGRGKNNKYYALIENWQDPGYICKHNKVQSSKGFGENEIMEFVILGKKKYLDKVEKTPAENSVTAVKSSTTPKSQRIPYQQMIIAQAQAEWYKVKRERKEQGQFSMSSGEAKDKVIELVCQAMRDASRGINVYLLQDLVYAVLYDDLDYRDILLDRLKSKVLL